MSVSKSVRNLGGTARERPIFRRLVGGIFLIESEGRIIHK
ncbi:hypothetical protein NCDO763_1311 [Lactococcus cremoris]|uniref:Uncharacterized protein n=1 Tax=Lactococcus lactis subsp. cremoris (strain MG1363) TaxID=416870 RepID=A2RNX7_LACLM|nr:hypothetical protein V4_0147 [Lactococcus cremoris]KZK41830.1 hypothetical protein N41_0106 [Lactococcus cremoris]KZK51386.1 hypothetical protein NCDO763_1311 [Lactococcus cremoris]CAL99022.1 hypothetical protein predicted by Glimmer [Lactococcus cremoris subsp. cremoris MG1363]